MIAISRQHNSSRRSGLPLHSESDGLVDIRARIESAQRLSAFDCCVWSLFSSGVPLLIAARRLHTVMRKFLLAGQCACTHAGAQEAPGGRAEELNHFQLHSCGIHYELYMLLQYVVYVIAIYDVHRWCQLHRETRVSLSICSCVSLLIALLIVGTYSRTHILVWQRFAAKAFFRFMIAISRQHNSSRRSGLPLHSESDGLVDIRARIESAQRLSAFDCCVWSLFSSGVPLLIAARRFAHCPA